MVDLIWLKPNWVGISFLHCYWFFAFFYFSVSRARILGDRDVLVQVGSDINLTCRAEESPDVPDGVVWYKNDIRVDNLLVRGGISVVTEVTYWTIKPSIFSSQPNIQFIPFFSCTTFFGGKGFSICKSKYSVFLAKQLIKAHSVSFFNQNNNFN